MRLQKKYWLAMQIIAILLVTGAVLVARPQMARALPVGPMVENGMDGEGTHISPYEVTNCEQLQDIQLNLSSVYILTGNIDCSDSNTWNSGDGFLPIGGWNDGNPQPFLGTLDGRGHTIDGLYIDQSGASGDTNGFVGMFGSAHDTAALLNFKLTNTTIIGNHQSGHGDASTGGIVGRLAGPNATPSLSQLSFSGTIELQSCTGRQHIGGVVGSINERFKMSKSSASGSINATGLSCDGYTYSAGGLVGTVSGSAAGHLEDSYSSMDITFDGEADSDCVVFHICRSIGGLVGVSNKSTLQINRSYSAGTLTVSGDSGEYLSYATGGLIGYMNNTVNTLSNSFSVSEFDMPADCDDLTCGPNSRTAGGIIGSDNNDSHYAESAGTLQHLYYDQTEAGGGSITCVGNDPTNNRCDAVNTDGSEPAYFENGASVAPLTSFDGGVWDQSNGLPVLQSLDLDPVAPSGLSTTIDSTTSISLTWSPDNASGIYRQYVYCKPSAAPATSWTVCDTTNNQSEATLTGLDPATQYSIQVAAVSYDGYFSVSSVVLATTATPGFELISSCADLQNINNDLDGNYELAQNIDCSDTITWNGGQGFNPIGVFDVGNSIFTPFTGIIAGNNYTISDLYCDRTTSCGLFEFSLGSLIQDVQLQSPTMSSPFVAASLAAIIANTTITNTHVRDVSISGPALIAGGFIGGISDFGSPGEVNTITKSSVTGDITVTGGPAALGGFAGIAGGNSQLQNNYAQVDITTDAVTAAGGFMGYMETEDASVVSRNYAAGSILVTSNNPNLNQASPFNPNIPNSLSLVGGFSGLIIDTESPDSSFATFTHNFAHVAQSNASPESTPGGFTAVTSHTNFNLTGNYFDADQADTTSCTASGTPTCSAISGQPNYFKNNSSNPPLNQWNFASIWVVSSQFPVFSAEATSSISTIPPERLNPPTPGTTGGSGGGTTEAATTVAESNSTAAATASTAGTSQSTSGDEAGVLGAIKQFVRNLPAGIVAAFPYALFILLGLAALALLIELARELRRLHVLRVLLRKQQLLAEERDAFWHLAANYLRAPITLIVGGAEALHDAGKTPATTELQSIAASLQAKVAAIMKKIEGSTSLQAISQVHPRQATQIARRAVFLVPVITVAVLALLGDYAATSYRNMSPGVIGYVAQLAGFILATILFYWVLSLLAQGKSKRQAAQTQLDRQTTELASARHELINDTAQQLNPDLKTLEGTLTQLTPKQTTLESTKTLQEGTSRLREIVTSFALLIRVQEGAGLVAARPQTSTVDLGNLLTKTRAKLRPRIAAKGVRVLTPAIPLAVQAEADLANQVLESIISNAVDYSPDNGTVKIEAQRLQDSIRLRVSDQGKGIDQQQLDHLFQPFIRADGTSAMDMSHGGFGINLYLDKLIMEQLGGSITATSTEGQGTAITMTWPTRS